MYQGDNISFNRQLQHHRITISRLTQLFRNTTATTNYLNKCLYSVGLGSNDYLNNYFLPFSLTSTLFTPEQYATALITQYSDQIRVRNIRSCKLHFTILLNDVSVKKKLWIILFQLKLHI